MRIALYALAASAFAIGTTEFVIMGILPDVARDLGVSLPAAGWLVSGYALGVAVGAPLMAVLTNGLRRKTALQLLMLLFIVGNLCSALAGSYSGVLISRIITSFTHGAFFGIGSVVAAGLVAPERRASAVALMFSGITLANVIGVPLGTLIGQAFGWRATFYGVTALGVMAQLALWFLIPAKLQADEEKISMRREMGVLRQPLVLIALLTTVMGFGGVFAVLTYITPLLQEVSGFSDRAVAGILLLFGVGLTVGNLWGGRLADKHPLQALRLELVALALIMALLSFVLKIQWLTIATIFAWGVAAFATAPALQMQIVTQASAAPNLAATLNIGAFNVGNALGAWLGGLMLISGHGLTALPWAAAAMAVAALLLVLLSQQLEKAAAPVAQVCEQEG
ncbi:MAG TPA: MFS transporter [Moraxellaceae bacterium]